MPLLNQYRHLPSQNKRSGQLDLCRSLCCAVWYPYVHSISVPRPRPADFLQTGRTPVDRYLNRRVDCGQIGPQAADKNAATVKILRFFMVILKALTGC